MRFTWGIPLPGPFRISGGGKKLRYKRRPHAKAWHGELNGWECPHNHTRPELATECARREARRLYYLHQVGG